MIFTDEAPKWAFRADALRPVRDYNDLMRVVASHYELYERGARYLSPWISRQNGLRMPFVAPDREEIKQAIGKQRSIIHPITYHSFISELHNFAAKTKGKRQLITPHQTTHHSAQFASGTFEISRAPVNTKLSKQTGQRKNLHAISVFGAATPVFVENMQINPDDIGFIIVRPRIGKLGTASAVNWEVLCYRQKFQYLIDHVDSNLNPRFSGIF